MHNHFLELDQVENNTFVMHGVNSTMFETKGFFHTTILSFTQQSPGYPGVEINALNLKNMFPVKYSRLLLGYIVPLLVLITAVTNTLVLAVLLQKHLRSSTNI